MDYPPAEKQLKQLQQGPDVGQFSGESGPPKEQTNPRNRQLHGRTDPDPDQRVQPFSHCLPSYSVPMASIPPLNPAVHSQPATRNMQIAGDAAAQPAMSGVTSDPDGIGTADLTAAQAGDHQAFGRLYDRHAAVVLSLCRRFLFSAAQGATPGSLLCGPRIFAKVSKNGRAG